MVMCFLMGVDLRLAEIGGEVLVGVAPHQRAYDSLSAVALRAMMGRSRSADREAQPWR